MRIIYSSVRGHYRISDRKKLGSQGFLSLLTRYVVHCHSDKTITQYLQSKAQSSVYCRNTMLPRHSLSEQSRTLISYGFQRNMEYRHWTTFTNATGLISSADAYLVATCHHGYRKISIFQNLWKLFYTHHQTYICVPPNSTMIFFMPLSPVFANVAHNPV